VRFDDLSGFREILFCVAVRIAYVDLTDQVCWWTCLRREPSHLLTARRCLARTRRGTPCQAKATSKGRCRLHGGALGSGAPSGSRNGNYRHGRFTQAAIAERRLIRQLLRDSRDLLNSLVPAR
jgi:glucans biosynthesis protein